MNNHARNKQLYRIIACILCAFLMCGILTACSGTGGSASKGAKMVGYWELTGGTSGGEELTADDIKTLKEMDLLFILYLSEDGKATFDSFGDVEDMTWDIENATLTVDDITGTLELSDDTLTYSDESDESNKFVFKKGDDSLAEKIETDRKSMEEGDAGTTVETQRVAIDPAVTIADDEVANITAVARVVDENGMGGIELAITNKSDERFASHTLDDATVNGGTYEIYYYAEVYAGETVNEVVAFDGVTTIDELKDINFTLTIYEVEYFNDLGVYEVSIP